MVIKEFLLKICDLVEDDDFAGASALISDYISSDPGMVDGRFKAELSMIEKMIDYKSNLKDWAYFRRMRLTYQYLEVQYVPLLQNDPYEIDTNETLPDADTIWCCWLQGIENAPAVIQKCVESLKRFKRKIVIITEDNYSDYISLPDYLIEKKNRGIIDRTHFSDLIRIELLSTRGGTWIDSTVFCSDASLMNEVFEKYDLFCYSFAMRDTISPFMLFDNWVLHSRKKSRIIEDTRRLLYMFWEKENYLMHYFLFHLIFAISCRRHIDEMNRIPVFSLEPCHMLQHEMKEPFDQLRWEQIMKMSGIHKMTYKYDASFDFSGTMLEHMLDQPSVES